MHRLVHLFGGIALALSLALLGGGARADSCVDLASGQNYDCSQMPPSRVQQATPPARVPLQKVLKTSSMQQNGYVQQLQDAAQRAQQAMTSAALTNDPTERAQFTRAYQAAMQDMQSSAGNLMAVTADPAQKAYLSNLINQSLGHIATDASQVGLQAVNSPPSTIRNTVQSPPPSQAASAPGNIFSVCEQPKSGVTTCYEIGATGNQCEEVWYQGGLRTLDRGATTCSPEDLAQRDAYFAGQPVGQAPPADPRSQQIAAVMGSMSAQCQQDLKNYLYGSRDSQGSRSAGDQALQSFANIQSNTACKQGYEQLSQIMGTGIPQRHLGAGVRNAWAGGMADRPRQVVNVPDVHDMPQGYYGDNSPGGGFDAGEVLGAGAQLFGVLGAILGGFAEGYGGGGYATYSSAPSRGYGGPSGSGYVYRPQRNNQSTITGTTR